MSVRVLIAASCVALSLSSAAKPSALPENQVRAAELCRSNDRCKAVMYTTWNADYREDKLCAFLKAFRGGGR